MRSLTWAVVAKPSVFWDNVGMTASITFVSGTSPVQYWRHTSHVPRVGDYVEIFDTPGHETHVWEVIRVTWEGPYEIRIALSFCAT